MVIAISSVTIPVGKSPLDQIPIGMAFSAPPTFGAVGLFQAGVSITSANIVIGGLTGLATFSIGMVAPGTYEVRVLVGDGTDSGQLPVVTPLVVVPVDAAAEVLYTKFQEAIRQTLIDSALVVVPDECIIMDRIANRAEDDFDPGIIIDRHSPSYTTERRTTNGKDYTFFIVVVTTTKKNYKGYEDDDDRQTIEALTYGVEQALDANRFLGGFLQIPLSITPIDQTVVENFLGPSFMEALLVAGRAEFLEL